MPNKPLTVTKRRSVCPIAGTLDIIGDKWTLLVIRDLMAGKNRYGELKDSPENIPTNILAARIKLLLETGLIDKELYQEHPPRYEYKLTNRGNKLGSILKEFKQWGLDNIKDTHAYIDI